MRETRLLSYALDPPLEAPDGDRVATNLECVLQLLDDAAAYDPDFVCFPEYVLQLRYRGDGLTRDAVSRPIPGPEMEAVGEKAAELGSYVWFPTIQRDEGRLYNAVTLIDPVGAVVGVAHKAAPTIGEMDEGTAPGERVEAWDTEFGRVAAGVCWDERYPELGVRYAEQRADLVFHPTTATSSQLFTTWAQYYGYYHVTCDKHAAWITTPTGARLASTSTRMGNPVISLPGGATARISFGVVNTDCGTYGLFQNHEVVDAIRERYGGSVAFHELEDVGVLVIESLEESLAIAEVEEAFGLETMFTYEERTRARVLERTERSPLLPFRETDASGR